jgi:hypothetical protein
MAERDFALLNPSEPKSLPSSYPNQGDNSAGFMFPYKLASGIMSGVQGVGFGGVNIDSNNNRITVGNITLDGSTNTITTENEDGSTVGMGLIPGTTQFGFFVTDTDGVVVQKIVSATYSINDKTNDRVLMGKDEGGF